MSTVDANLVAGVIDSEPMEERRAASRWQVLGRLEKTAIGRRRAGGETAVRCREPAGCLLYGPYWQLPSGPYRLSFRCRTGKPRMSTEPVLGVEVIAMNRVQLAWLDLTEDELCTQTGALDFSVPPVLGLGAGDEARLEFRFFHLGNADLTIGAVDLQSLPVAETPAGAPRRWRMLGRLERMTIGRRREAPVTVRQMARPGCLLDGGRPLLQLPRGHYRLSFGCAVGTPKMAQQPVLGLEILARRRWSEGHRVWSLAAPRDPPESGRLQLGWADFTERELCAGSGSIDFEVPAELSLEGGEEVVFGFRFAHFGNADLTIRAVELQQVTSQETGRRPLREWRLLGRLYKGLIGTLRNDRVTVRQAEPANILLRGAPDLQLPAGRYRLGFCCRAGLPRNRSRPVLAVEVAVRLRLWGSEWREAWHSPFGPRRLVRERRYFTAEELEEGSASVNFEVSTEMSRELGRDPSLEFRFVHLGNADLSFSAVNLQEATPADLSGSSFRSLISANRTKVLIIGNCQAQTLQEALVRSSELCTRLDAKYHFVGLQQDLHEAGRAELESCDILLVQDIRDWDNYPLRPYIREDVRVIKFPLLHFASLWPFDHYNGPGDKEAYDREWPNLTFLYHDGLLARLRKEIPDHEQRLDAYRTLSVADVINYVRLHDFEKRRLTAMDKKFGCEIGQFILDNFQRKRLFYTTNHPNGQIIGLLMQYLLQQLGTDQGYRPNSSLDHLKRLQVPVHPKVAEALGVTWAKEHTKYLYGGEQITWETYVRRYIDHYG